MLAVETNAGHKRIEDQSRVRARAMVRPTLHVVGNGIALEHGENEFIIDKAAFERLQSQVQTEERRLVEIAAEQLERKRQAFLKEYQGPDPDKAFPGSLEAEYHALTVGKDMSPFASLEKLEDLPPAKDEAHVTAMEHAGKVLAAQFKPLFETLLSRDESKHARK